MTLMLMALVWYSTKIYYTHTFKIKITQSNLDEMTCAKCAVKVYIQPENKRTPFYCWRCS